MTVILGSLFWSGQKATAPETETLPKQLLLAEKKKKKCSIVKGLISLRINLPIFPQIPSGTDGPLVAQ